LPRPPEDFVKRPRRPAPHRPPRLRQQLTGPPLIDGGSGHPQPLRDLHESHRLVFVPRPPHRGAVDVQEGPVGRVPLEDHIPPVHVDEGGEGAVTGGDPTADVGAGHDDPLPLLRELLSEGAHGQATLALSSSMMADASALLSRLHFEEDRPRKSRCWEMNRSRLPVSWLHRLTMNCSCFSVIMS